MSKHEQFSQPGSPVVEIPQRVIDRYGEPSVNLDGLSELFSEDINMDPEAVTLKFYSGHQLGEIEAPGDFWRNGYRMPYTSTLHVPTWDVMAGITPMSKVIALGLNLERRQNQSLAVRHLATEMFVGGAAAFGAGVEVDNTGLQIAGFSVALLALSSKATNSDPKKSVNGYRLHELRTKHDSDITFARHNARGMRYIDVAERP